jgi:hypothetical protein
MKKTIAIMLAIVLTIILTACGGDATPTPPIDNTPPNGGGDNAGGEDTTPAIPDLPAIDENPVSDFEYKAIAGGVEITKYIGTSIRVRIPEIIEGVPVISIGDSAFENAGIMEVYIPDGVINIGRSAFSGNEALTTVTIPDGVTRLDHTTFHGCVSLPAGVQRRIQRLIYGDFDIIEFGGYEWLVLEESGGRALVLSLGIIETRAYHSEWVEITWEHSTIRQYLNGEFYNSFSPADQARIVDTNVINNDNPLFHIPGGDNTTDKIFLLSIDEANQYFADDSARIAYNMDGTPWWWGWWLRSPGYYSGDAAAVNHDGSVSVHGGGVIYDSGGVRPALWLNL